VQMPLRKLYTNVFDILSLLCAYASKFISFIYIRVNSVFSTVAIYYTSFLNFQIHGTFEALKTKIGGIPIGGQ